MFVACILSRIRANQRYHQTIRELTRYTDHQLNDIGISRFEIDVIAHRQYNP